ncbi:MAG: hypothetical protein IPK08_19340 [Bacteroidetes bacterium]|nr:hypothetical protein [Bacteroidota bacterium]
MSLVKRYNVAPSQLSLVMTDAQPEKLQWFKWGLTTANSIVGKDKTLVIK